MARKVNVTKGLPIETSWRGIPSSKLWGNREAIVAQQLDQAEHGHLKELVERRAQIEKELTTTVKHPQLEEEYCTLSNEIEERGIEESWVFLPWVAPWK